MTPQEIIRRHWFWLAPTWCVPVLMIVLVVAEDIGGDPLTISRGFRYIVGPLFLLFALPALCLVIRTRLPWITFYLAWLGPMMALWLALILLRALVIEWGQLSHFNTRLARGRGQLENRIC
jgi:hypothetical protein